MPQAASEDTRPWAGWSEDHQAPVCPQCGYAMTLLAGQPERWMCPNAWKWFSEKMYLDKSKKWKHNEVTVYKRAGAE